MMRMNLWKPLAVLTALWLALSSGGCRLQAIETDGNIRTDCKRIDDDCGR